MNKALLWATRTCLLATFAVLWIWAGFTVRAGEVASTVKLGFACVIVLTMFALTIPRKNDP